MILRCRAPRKPARHASDLCRGYVIDAPDWMAPAFIGLLAHSDLKRHPDNLAPACQRCGILHEIALRNVMPRRAAA